VALGRIQEPTWRHRVRAQGVDAVRDHVDKVLFDDSGRGKCKVVLVRAERAICDASHVELRIIYEDELSMGDRPIVPSAYTGRALCSDAHLAPTTAAESTS
jgi:hypothetical protein